MVFKSRSEGSFDSNQQLNRRFYVRANVFLVVKPVGREDIFEQIGNVIIGFVETLTQFCDSLLFSTNIFIDEIFINFGGQKLGCFFSFQNHLNYIFTFEIARFSKNGFLSVIVLKFSENKSSLQIEIPARKRSCNFLDVFFSIVSSSEREKLH